MINTRLAEVLAGKRVSYIFPFFWQQGESEEILREYMGAIYDCGIYEVCVESRVHPDFNGPRWWHDMNIIMDEARTRGMRVWMLDDLCAPTGYANGAFKTADPELCIQFLNFQLVDVVGPTPHVTIDVDKMSHEPQATSNQTVGVGSWRVEKRVFTDDQLLAAIAYRIEEGDKLGDCRNLTGQVRDGRITWDVPSGYWRIYVSYLTRNAGIRNDMMNILDGASVRLFLDSIYEPEYAHFKDDFGKTFAGFFLDEPSYCNMVGWGRDIRIGRLEMPLPWSKQMPGMLEERLGSNWANDLPHLWHAGADGDFTARVRYAYMDAITELVRVNFSNQLGGWCAAHAVESVGHCTEDNNGSSHLGSALGHFYRPLDGQQMAGIDEVILQVVFGGENARHLGSVFVHADGNFYHAALGKLASSHAHIDPKKRGRALCEIWGASGWAFGIRNMKYVANHFLVRGVNRYTPHAFNPDTFPSKDGPPHFYAHGENPQYRHFGALSRYMQRVCHLIDGGLHIAPAAILYNGEADWVGPCMFEQYPARKLTE
ncbi:MAG: glycoside hydrolase family 2, partial [Anaerolineae bacterium]